MQSKKTSEFRLSHDETCSLGDLLAGDNLPVQLLSLGQSLGHREPQNLVFLVLPGRATSHVSGHLLQDGGVNPPQHFAIESKYLEHFGGTECIEVGSLVGAAEWFGLVVTIFVFVVVDHNDISVTTAALALPLASPTMRLGRLALARFVGEHIVKHLLRQKVFRRSGRSGWIMVLEPDLPYVRGQPSVYGTSTPARQLKECGFMQSTHRPGSNVSRLTTPFLTCSTPTIVRECPLCWRIIGGLSVTMTARAPIKRSRTVADVEFPRGSPPEK